MTYYLGYQININIRIIDGRTMFTRQTKVTFFVNSFFEKGPDIGIKQTTNFDQYSMQQRRPSVKKEYSVMQEYFCQLDELEGLLKTSFVDGLSTEEANERHSPFNYASESDWKILMKEINLFTYVLILGAVISGALAIDGFSQNTYYRTETMTFCLLIFVLTLTIVMGFQQRKKSKSALKRDYGTKAQVIRGGVQTEIEVNRLVPGDLYEIREGTLIPADLRVLESRDLQVQNDDNILQAQKGSQVFQGSLIRSGSGRGVVIKIGNNTTLAQIRSKKTTPMRLQSQLYLLQLVIIGSMSFFILLALIWGGLNWSLKIREAMKTIVQIMIASIPETLLVIVTISFQMATRRMNKLNLLVKDPESIERMSEVNCFCFGLNQVVTKKYRFNSFHNNEQLLYKARQDDMQEVLKCGMYTSQLSTFDRTEKAVYKYLKQFGNVECKHYTHNGVQFNTPFNSSKKYAISITEDLMIYIKGAPEVIWAFCTHTTRGVITPAMTTQFTAQLQQQCRKGLRAVGFAYIQLYNEDQLRMNDYGYDLPMQNFTYMGTMYLSIVIPKESIQLIQQFKDQHIKMIVVTGEHPETAKWICMQSGLFRQPQVIHGSELYLHVEDQDNVTRLSSVENKIRAWLEQPEIIFARTFPEQLLPIVKTLQQMQFIVAVTGEQLPDLASFRQADVSIARRNGSQQMCIQSSDVVLTGEQSFLQLFDALMESKRAVNNTVKAISFCLSSNTAMSCALLAYIILGTPLPLSQNLMLVISITVDLIVGISLAREELEIHNNKRTQIALYSCMLIGAIQAAGGLICALSTLMYFGFTLDSILYTRFQNGYSAANSTYNPTLGNLGNTNLPVFCQLNESYPQIYYQWSDYTMDEYDQRMVFMDCGACSEAQNSFTQYLCWNSARIYRDCLADSEPDLKKYCYTGEAGYFAQNSFYAFLVIAQCMNYFAVRTQLLPFRQQKLNDLAIFGIFISLGSILINTYTPGLQYVFETTRMPWPLMGGAGLPLCILILFVAEIHKYLLRRYLR